MGVVTTHFDTKFCCWSRSKKIPITASYVLFSTIYRSECSSYQGDLLLEIVSIQFISDVKWHEISSRFSVLFLTIMVTKLLFALCLVSVMAELCSIKRRGKTGRGSGAARKHRIIVIYAPKHKLKSISAKALSRSSKDCARTGQKDYTKGCDC